MAEEHQVMSSTLSHKSIEQQQLLNMDMYTSTAHQSVAGHETGACNNSAADQVLKLVHATSSDDQNNLLFIANAINYLDRLTASLNKQNTLVQNLQQMIPPVIAPASESAESNHSSQDVKSPGSTLSQNLMSPQSFHEQNGLVPQLNRSNSQPVSDPNQKQYLNSDKELHSTSNGGISRKQRYQRTHDALKKSGLLDIAKKTSILMKQSSQLDRQIAAFKAIVSEHCKKITNESGTLRLQSTLAMKQLENVSHIHLNKMNENFQQQQNCFGKHTSS